MPSTTRCPQCRTALTILDPRPAQPVICPACKHTWTYAGQSSQPPPGPAAPAHPEPLSLDDEPAEGESRARPRGKGLLVPVALVGGLILLVGGAAAGLLLAGRKTETADEPPGGGAAASQPAAGGGAEPAKALGGEQVYQRLLKSTVLVITPDGLGSGVVVHAGRRLVLTNHHVAGGHARVVVLFPADDAKGQLVTNVEHYAKNARQLGVPAKVLDATPRKDLAVLELERLPADARAVAFAPRPAPTGSAVYSVGASGIDRNLLWKLTTGVVSGRSEREAATASGTVSAMILETSAGVNPGDSGGPVVNDRAELVGVVAHYDRRQRDVSGNIDLVEVNDFLRGVARKGGWTWEPPSSAAPEPPANDSADVKRLVALLADPDAGKRLAAVRRLAALGADAHPAVPDLLPRLDDPDGRVRVAAAEALEKVGPPGPADAPALDAALRSGGPNARLVALRFYADPARKVPEPLLPEVVKGLSDTLAEARKAAVQALGNYGPGCKPRALAGLLNRLADDDPAVAAEAARVVPTLAPFGESDRPALVSRLANGKAVVRLAAATALAADAPDAATATRWFRSTLTDVDARVRSKAVEALARWGPKVKDCLPDLLTRLADDSPAVAATAAKAVVAVDGGPEVVAGLAKALGPGEARAEVRDAAAEAVLTLEFPDAESGVPVLVLAIGVRKPDTRSAALARLAKYGAAAKPALPAIRDRLGDGEPVVRVAALKALAAFGPDAADAVPAVAALLDGKQPDAVAVAAAEALGGLGPKAVEPLTRALEAKLPGEALVRVCEGLGRFGKDARSAGPALLDAVTKQRPLAELAVTARAAVADGKPWEPDPVAAAVARLGGDEVAKRLCEWSAFETKTVGGAKTRVAVRGDGAMLWGTRPADHVLDG